MTGLSGYRYAKQPIEELSRADMLSALIEAHEHIEDLQSEVDELKAEVEDLKSEARPS